MSLDRGHSPAAPENRKPDQAPQSRLFAEVPSGRRIWVIWRFDRDDEQVPDVFGEVEESPIFVITAYCLRVYPHDDPPARPEERAPQGPGRTARLRAAPAPPGRPSGRAAAPLGDASSPPSPRGRCRGGGERGGAPARPASEAARAVASDRRGSRALLTSRTIRSVAKTHHPSRQSLEVAATIGEKRREGCVAKKHRPRRRRAGEAARGGTMRHRRLRAPYPAYTIIGLIAHLSQSAPRISTDAFASRFCQEGPPLVSCLMGELSGAEADHDHQHRIKARGRTRPSRTSPDERTRSRQLRPPDPPRAHSYSRSGHWPG